MPITFSANRPAETGPQPAGHAFEKHDIWMILILVIISLRSVMWNIFQLLHENNYRWLLAIAAAAFAGKIIGGMLADKIGWRVYALTSTLLAAPLVTFFKNELLFFCIGIGLLQSDIPATTAMLISSMKGNTAAGISHAFGTAVILAAALNFLPPHFLVMAIPVFLFLIILVLLRLRLPAANPWKQ